MAKTSASSIAPAPVNTQPSSEIGPAAPASVAGSMNTPDPIMLPTTSAVAIHRPIVRLSFGGAELDSTGAGAVAIVNVNALRERPRRLATPKVVNYRDESLEQRRARRREQWTPVFGPV